jgi:hypothetical protein
VHYFVIEAHPKPGSELYGRVDGAYVSCWVNNPIRDAAEAEARALIDEAGWDAEATDTADWLDDDHYGVDQPEREYFEQARVDGIVAVYHRWHVGAPDE